jgi:hypothetical protein
MVMIGKERPENVPDIKRNVTICERKREGESWRRIGQKKTKNS